MECTVENKKQVKLDLVVNAAIVDLYEDTGKYYQRASFMASRGLKKLYTEVLPKIHHKVWITVNKSTHTATLPLDFQEETFVGFIDQLWHKVPMKLNNRLTDSKNIVDIPCEDTCPKCNQSSSICNDLVVTEQINLIVINGGTYQQTITKKLYPNGDYYLETSTPVLNINTNNVDYAQSREFIVNFDLNPCGCLANNPVNTANLITFCPDIYCNYYAPCDSKCNTNYGGYKIFEESGLIQFDANFPFDKCYLEYYGYITKIGGQYYVPLVSFETLVEWTKWKLVQNKRNIPISEREWQKQNYIRERRNMERVLGRINLYQIIQSIALLPKFDIDYGCDWYSYFTPAATTAAISNTSSATTIINNNTTMVSRANYTLALKVDGNIGSPINATSTYQNNILKGAIDLNYIFLAKLILTIKDNDFTFNSATGVIDISPNLFFTGDSLIINYNKNS